jgi:dipeptidyl aminopeptidase/acylaminoacyl peptidase
MCTRLSKRARSLAPAVALPLALFALPVLAGLGLPGHSLAGQAPGVTLEGILDAPFPEHLTPAPVGGAVAWVRNDRGVRNVWVASPPQYQPVQLTTYAADDGQELGSLTWTPDGRGLVFVRGGSPNRQGENPNPASDPAGVEQALWYFASVSAPAEPRRLGPGSAPVMAPDGSGIAFLRGGAIWFAPLQAGTEPTVLVRARGGLGSVRWAPDGRKLAFVSNRGTHAFVGILDRDAGEIRWMDPSVDRDSNPVWSPDGSRLAFIRIPTASEITLFRPVREAEPWGIRVADVRTGASEEIWRARRGQGSAFWGMSAGNQLLWAAGDRLIFPWEGTGWLSLYSVSVRGGEAIPLTPGSFEVEQVTLDAPGTHVYFNSNQDDIDRRHLWRVPVDGSSRPERLTTGSGIAWAPTPTADGEALVFFRSDARLPAHEAILPLGPAGRPSGPPRTLFANPIPASFPTAALVEPQAVMISASDGMRVPAQLFLPPDLAPGERRPAVAFFHGGSRRQMLLGFHYMGYYHHTYAMNQYLATRGFIVLSVNFRSGTGYGLDFREALQFGATGASEFHDVMGAGLYLRGRADVDPARIGLWGGSYGGYLTAMGLARASDLYAAGVDVHGVHDWNVGIETFRPDYNPLVDPERTRVAFDASPMAHLNSWRSPVLVIHGDDDRNVRFVETVHLVEELRKREVEVEQVVLPDEVHGFLLHRNWLTVLGRTAEFLERRLGR